MRVRILVQLRADEGAAGEAREIACFEKEANRPEAGVQALSA
jgi:hypothetical protein